MQQTNGVRNIEAKTKVFISYSRKDMAFADRLEAALKARGFEVLIDRQEIYAFEDWWKRVEALIGGADTVVFVLSPDAVKSEVALKEVSFAASLHKRFAPIVCRRVEDNAVPEALRRLNFIFFDDTAQFDESADKLNEALQTDIGWIRRHTEFGEAARRWAEAGRPTGMLLRPPLLDQAEAWLTLRPRGAPAPTGGTEDFVVASRRAELAIRRRSRMVNVTLYAMLVGIIVGLVGWINQAFIAEQWNWWTVMRPYMLRDFRPYVLKPEQESALQPGEAFKECAADCPEMIVIPAGKFMMGSPASHGSGGDPVLAARALYGNEQPLHEVTLARSLAISKYDVTFANWDACAAVGGCAHITDNGMGRGSKPLVNVTWKQAQHYVGWLAKLTGRPYRLLSEAEWEYAARAGTTTAYYWGEEIGKGNANCIGCDSAWDGRETSPVGSFKPNPFGLYDMAGNVWQWEEDCYQNNYIGAPTDGSPRLTGDCEFRVLRGGSWSHPPDTLRSAFRDKNSTDKLSDRVGFRVARTLNSR